MRIRIRVRHLDEIVTRDECLASHRTLGVTYERVTRRVITRTHGDELIARKVDTVKFVRKKDLKRVEDRVDIPDPAKVDRHLRNANHEACINDQTSTRTPAPAMACDAVFVTAAVVRKIAAMTKVAIYVTTDRLLAQLRDGANLICAYRRRGRIDREFFEGQPGSTAQY
jgi:hypothetical protein